MPEPFRPPVDIERIAELWLIASERRAERLAAEAAEAAQASQPA